MKLLKNRRKLNNKGFTLIELLAVIVILAVVIGIAAGPVIGVINKSKKNGLQDSAASAADAFRVAYGEMALNNSTTILGIDTTKLLKEDPTATENVVAFNENVANALNITASNYDLEKSFVMYEIATGKFTVCMTAAQDGSYYVVAAEGGEITKGAVTTGKMWACSDNTHSWTN